MQIVEKVTKKKIPYSHLNTARRKARIITKLAIVLQSKKRAG